LNILGDAPIIRCTSVQLLLSSNVDSKSNIEFGDLCITNGDAAEETQSAALMPCDGHLATMSRDIREAATIDADKLTEVY